MSKFIRNYYKDYLKADTTNKIYSIILPDGTEESRPRSWFDALCNLNIIIPEDYKSAIRYLKFYNQEISSRPGAYKQIAVFSKPVYHKEFKDMRMIAKYPYYFISKFGVVYNMLDDKFVGVKAYRDYPTVQVKSSPKHPSVTERLHRLVALTWVDNEDYTKYNTVDHINGDKTYYHADNLRWVTGAENTQLATFQGLRADNIPVVIRNIDTGTIKAFPSLTTAAEYMGRSRILTTNTDLRYGKIWHTDLGRFEMKYLNDKRDWYFKHNKKPTPKYVRYIFRVTIPGLNKKNVVKEFRSPREAYMSLVGEDPIGMLDVNVINTLKALYPNYKFEFAKNEGYEAYNGKQEFKAETSQALSDLIGVPKSTIIKYTTLGTRYKQWVFRRSNPLNEKWVYPKLEEPKNTPKKIEVLDLETGERISSYSLRELSRKINVDRRNFKAKYSTGDIIKGRYKVLFPY